MNNPSTSLRPGHKSGFSLLEMSLVLMITGAVTASGFYLGKSMYASANIVSTNNRLDTIEKALMAYRLANERIPCPADATQAATSAMVGAELPNPGTCTGANFSVTVSGDTVVEGAVPVDALQLPRDYMYDGWGRKFGYAVWTGMTGASAFLNYGAQTNCGAIGMCSSYSGTTYGASGIYTLISYGPNGHGAYTSSGARMSSGSDNQDELVNCHCYSDATNAGYHGIYVMHDATQDPADALDSFDDIVRFKERWQMQSVEDTYSPTGNDVCSSPAAGAACNLGGSSGGNNAGFRIDGDSNLGSSMAIGDINGDGIPDLIIGASAGSGAGQNGAVYVIFGTRSGFPNPLPISSLNGTNGFRIDAENTGDCLGITTSVGNISGHNNGIKDIIIGAVCASPNGNADSGSTYVVFGHSGTWPTSMSLSTLNGTNGFRLDGENANNWSGSHIAAGDINGDGIQDVIIGAGNASPGGNSNAGSTYVVFGHSGAWTTPISLSTLNGSNGFRLDGENAHDGAGVVATGDINGDGIQDVIIGATNARNVAGSTYVVFGHSGAWTTPISLSTLNGSNGFRLDGENPGDYFGWIPAAGDINGDGIQDIIIGAYGASPGGNTKAGSVYVVFGHSGAWTTPIGVTNLNGSNGFRIDNMNAYEYIGGSINAGDINSDGIQDVIMGDRAASPGGITNSGSIYVLFGHSGVWSTPTILSTLNGSNGFRLNGTSVSEQIGGTLTVGDINGDGKADLATAAIPHYGAASVYVFFGKQQSTWANPYNIDNLCTGGSC